MLLDQGKIGHLDVMVGSHESFVDENDRFVISSIIETRLTIIKTHITILDQLYNSFRMLFIDKIKCTSSVSGHVLIMNPFQIFAEVADHQTSLCAHLIT